MDLEIPAKAACRVERVMGERTGDQKAGVRPGRGRRWRTRSAFTGRERVVAEGGETALASQTVPVDTGLGLGRQNLGRFSDPFVRGVKGAMELKIHGWGAKYRAQELTDVRAP